MRFTPSIALILSSERDLKRINEAARLIKERFEQRTIPQQDQTGEKP